MSEKSSLNPEIREKSPFVHLHVHTQYSLLEGAIRMEALFDQVKALGMDAVAITDLHNLFGAIDFYQSAREAGVKPILGCEVFFAPEGIPPGQKVSPHHLVLLCKDLAGYRNLCRMISQSYLQLRSYLKSTTASGKPPRAHIDRKLLDQYGEGLIVLSGCLRGELSQKILSSDESSALESVKWFHQRFKEDFFLELQDSALPEQAFVNETLSEWGKKQGIGCVATVDCHYLKPEDAEAHEILQCIEYGKNLDLERPKSLVPIDYWLKPPELIAQSLSRYPEALEATRRIADRCNVEFKFKDAQGRVIYHLPNFRPDSTPENGAPAAIPFDLKSYFQEQARQGLSERFESAVFEKKRKLEDWPEHEKQYHARLEDELEMIGKTGFAGYFLIVADFINWAKKNGIPVGPGRGSGAGSLVAYALKITDIDPIEFKLLFERFINPERISMPDFDVDFCQDRRGEVIDYVSKKYGAENVCQIITFGKLQARAVIRDVGRVLGLSFAETDQITKLLPDELDITIGRALEAEPLLRDRMESDAKVAQVIRTALSLEGLYRNAGIHAAGVIITEEPIVNYCPLFVGKDGDVVTQFDKDFAESIGLVKFDFLGLKTLTVIENAVKLIRSTALPGEEAESFSLDRMAAMDDEKTFQLIGTGDTDGVFQVESSGMKDLCLRILPNSIEDLTAINALYRPGPLGSGMVDDFIDRKHGRKSMAYELDQLEPILRDTYGVILYQEQVMQIARELAGYSLGQADLLRRAMGKKKPEEMASHRELFVQGAVARGLPQAKAAALFDLMAKFAEYGFNKSHSAAYAVLTYQTAYLKTHYAPEFLAAIMTTEMDSTEKLAKYIADARAHRIQVLPPDVNASLHRFRVERLNGEKAIRYGLEAIKGVGSIAVDAMIQARDEGGPFKNLLDFCNRVPSRKINKKVLESLTLAGALDSLFEATPGVNRATLFQSIEGILAFSSGEQAERDLGQASFFDALPASQLQVSLRPDALFKQGEDWPLARKLILEKQVLGFYMSGHPMDPWQKICDDWLGWNTEKIRRQAQEKAEQKKRGQLPAPSGGWGQGEGGRYQRPSRPEIRCAGILHEMKEVTTKKGQRMAFGQLEDLHGRLEVVFFPESFAASQELLKRAASEAEPLWLHAEFEASEDQAKLFAKKVLGISEAYRDRLQQLTLRLKVSQVTQDQLRALKKNLLEHRGKSAVRIDFYDDDFETRLDLPSSLGISITPGLVQALEGLFGSHSVRLN